MMSINCVASRLFKNNSHRSAAGYPPLRRKVVLLQRLKFEMLFHSRPGRRGGGAVVAFH